MKLRIRLAQKLAVVLSLLSGLLFSESQVWAQGYLQNMSEADQAYGREDYGKAVNLYRATLQQVADGGGLTDDPLAISLVDKLGLSLYRLGNFSEAESTFERERTSIEQAEQREKTLQAATKPAAGTKAYCISHLADAQFANQNYSSAKENYQQALEVLRNASMDYGLDALNEHAKKQIQLCEQKLRH